MPVGPTHAHSPIWMSRRLTHATEPNKTKTNIWHSTKQKGASIKMWNLLTLPSHLQREGRAQTERQSLPSSCQIFTDLTLTHLHKCYEVPCLAMFRLVWEMMALSWALSGLTSVCRESTCSLFNEREVRSCWANWVSMKSKSHRYTYL